MNSSLVRELVGVTGGLLSGLMAPVLILPFSGTNEWGAPVFYSGISTQAIIAPKNTRIQSSFGTDTKEVDQIGWHADLTVPFPVPIGPLDWVTMPDGKTRQILTVEGVQDPGTGQLFASKVTI